MKRRVWRKIHIGIDEQTLEIRAAEFTTSDVGDAPMPPELLDHIPPEQQISNVTADGAFDTRKCHEAIAARGAAAIIPPHKKRQAMEARHGGGNRAKRSPARIKTLRPDHLATMERLPPPKPRRNQEALCEPKVRGAKLLGQRRTARDFNRRVAEFQVRVAVLNGFTPLGIPVAEVVG